jgi:hypothetical protein
MTPKSNSRDSRFRRFASSIPLKPTLLTFGALAAFAFGFDLSVRSDAAPPLRPSPSVRPVEPTPADAPIAPDAATKSNVPFAGIATKTPEEIDAELAGKSTLDLQVAAIRLEYEHMGADAAVLFERVIYSDDATVEMRVRALESFDFFRDHRKRSSSVDERFLELSRRFSDSWRIQTTLVENHLNRWPKLGAMVDGAFVRYAQGKAQLDSTARDRVLALQILSAALPKALAEQAAIFPNGLDAAPDVEALKASVTFKGRNANFIARQDDLARHEFLRFYRLFERTLAPNGIDERWRLQTKTDLDVLPDFEPAQHRYYASRYEGAPVDADGNPVFFATPETFEAARNDGERVRYLEARRVAVASRRDRFQILMEHFVEHSADFFNANFYTLLDVTTGMEVV